MCERERERERQKRKRNTRERQSLSNSFNASVRPKRKAELNVLNDKHKVPNFMMSDRTSKTSKFVIETNIEYHIYLME